LRLLPAKGDMLLESAAPVGRLSATTALRGSRPWQLLPTFLWTTPSIPALRCPTSSWTSAIRWAWLSTARPAWRCPGATPLAWPCRFQVARHGRRRAVGRLKQVQSGTVGVLLTGFAAEATMEAASQASFRHVLPRREGFDVWLASRGREPPDASCRLEAMPEREGQEFFLRQGRNPSEVHREEQDCRQVRRGSG
jgi:hypothetical protein